MKILATLGKAHMLKVAIPAGGASLLALAAVFDAPPFGNIWFDMLAGIFILFLLQTFAFSLQPPARESSDWYRSFYRFAWKSTGIAAFLALHSDEWKKFGENIRQHEKQDE